MYIPKQFEINNKAEIFDFINHNAFGQLISQHQGKVISTHLPFLVSDDQSKLKCHLAKLNQQYTDIVDQEVLITFLGPHGYISPSWHDEPGIATWNYQAVHVYGRCSIIQDKHWLKEVVEKLSDKYENLAKSNWQPNYRDELLNAIIGLEVEINEIQCKYKLSQNRSEQGRQQIIQALEERGSQSLAEVMKNNQDKK